LQNVFPFEIGILRQEFIKRCVLLRSDIHHYFSIGISWPGYDPLEVVTGMKKLKGTWILWTGTVLAALNLGACGGSSAPVAPTLYTIGGTITGLTAGGLSLANGTDTATVAVNATGFTMPTPLAANSRYAVQVSAQPSGLICSVAGSAGVVPQTNVTGIQINCIASWTWMGGANTANSPGNYGIRGSAAADNVPGARQSEVTWTDGAGNLWLFGGSGYDSTGAVGLLNDLWAYSLTTQQWTWMGGSNTANSIGIYGTLGSAAASNVPGARAGAVSWTDGAGNFWLFGGSGYDSLGQSSADPHVGNLLNDLWMYNPTTQQWSWMSGSNTIDATTVYGSQGTAAAGNVPGARSGAVSWSDGTGNLWLFAGSAGAATNYYLNELWMYSPSTELWTWVGGNQGVGVYGTQGIAAVGNLPGARVGMASWTDHSGNAWVFGGDGVGAVLNDLWMFNPTTRQWTWISGSEPPPCCANPIGGIYGTENIAAAANVPGARAGSASWTDSAGNLWLFGGSAAGGVSTINFSNDLWMFSPATKQWTWVSGSATPGAPGTYGTLGTAAPGNVPGARAGAAAWTDDAGNHWLYGGGNLNPYGDLWKF
jgi:N-acetylneuraminic acid mutarotase